MRRQIGACIARPVAAISLILMMVNISPAAQVISVHAGIIQYIEGDVFLDGKLLRLSPKGYVQMEKGQSLNTMSGRLELLLSPNIYLRLSENGSLRLDQNQLQDTQLTLGKGCALIEVVQEIRGNRVRVHLPPTTVEIRKAGLYRIDAGSGEIRVYGGEALATSDNRRIVIKKGKMAHLDAHMASAKFDVNIADSMLQWAARRSFDLFDAVKSNLRQQNWKLIAMGWALNSNYRMRFRSQRLFDEWVKSRQIERAIDSQLGAAAAQAESSAAAQTAAAQAAAAAAIQAGTISAPQPPK